MSDLFLLGIASPYQYRRLPARGKRGSMVWWSKPRAAGLTQLAIAEALMQLDQTVALVPPMARPLRQLMEEAHWALPDEATAKHESALWALAHPGDDDALSLAATVIPAGLRDDQGAALVIAGHLRDPQRASWTSATRERLTQVLNPDAISIIDAPCLPGWSDCGSAAVLHLRSSDDPSSDHLLAAHQRAHAMPGQLLPRKVEPRADAEAQRAALRAGQLKRGHALFARQLWAATDGGAEYIDQIACTGSGLLLVHQIAFGDQHDVMHAAERRVAGLRCLQVDHRDVPVDVCTQSGLLAGLVVSDIRGQQHYLVPERASSSDGAGNAGRKWLEKLSSAQITAQTIPGDLDALGGSLGRCCLRIPDAGPDHVREGRQLRLEQLPALRQWAERYLPEERLPDQITAVTKAESTATNESAEDALLAILG